MSDASAAGPTRAPAFESWARLAAHQLGESLALVRGAATVINGSGARAAPDVASALTMLGAGTVRAQRFVDDLLDVVHLSQQPADEPAAVELSRALEAARADLDEALTTSRTAIRADEDLPAAALERSEAERLFTHLLRSAAAAGARTVWITGGTADGAVTLEVVDDGAAFPEPDEAAAALGVGPARGRGPLVGAGLSLLICRLIAERRGGSLHVDRRADETTAVSVSLPRPQ